MSFSACKINLGPPLKHAGCKNPSKLGHGAVLCRSWAEGMLGQGRSEQPYLFQNANFAKVGAENAILRGQLWKQMGVNGLARR